MGVILATLFISAGIITIMAIVIESVADNDNATLIGPGSVVAADAFDINDNVGLITAISIYF